jgi:hypothetical protein
MQLLAPREVVRLVVDCYQERFGGMSYARSCQWTRGSKASYAFRIQHRWSDVDMAHLSGRNGRSKRLSCRLRDDVLQKVLEACGTGPCRRIGKAAGNIVLVSAKDFLASSPFRRRLYEL